MSKLLQLVQNQKIIVSALIGAFVYLGQFFHIDLHDVVPLISTAISNGISFALAIVAVVGAIEGHVHAQQAITAAQSAEPLKSSSFGKAVAVLALLGIVAPLAACNDPNILGDVTGTITTGVATAQDILATAQLVEQNNNGKKITASQVISDAQLVSSNLTSSNLASTAQAFVDQINKTISDLQAKGASQQTIIQTVAAQTAAAQVTAQAIASSPASSSTSTSLFQPTGWSQPIRIVKD